MTDRRSSNNSRAIPKPHPMVKELWQRNPVASAWGRDVEELEGREPVILISAPAHMQKGPGLVAVSDLNPTSRVPVQMQPSSQRTERLLAYYPKAVHSGVFAQSIKPANSQSPAGVLPGAVGALQFSYNPRQSALWVRWAQECYNPGKPEEPIHGLAREYHTWRRHLLEIVKQHADESGMSIIQFETSPSVDKAMQADLKAALGREWLVKADRLDSSDHCERLLWAQRRAAKTPRQP